MSVNFIDNSSAIKAMLEEALTNGLKKSAEIIHSATQANGGKAAKSWKSHVDTDNMTATISNDHPDAVVDEFGKGEFATGAKGSIAPVRPLETALVTKKHVIEKAFADELKDMG